MAETLIKKVDNYYLFENKENNNYNIVDYSANTIVGFFETKQQALLKLSEISQKANSNNINTDVSIAKGTEGKEEKPPSVPPNNENMKSKSGEPSNTPIYARDVPPKTGIHNENNTITHVCDFTIDLRIEMLKQEIKHFIERMKERMESKTAFLAGYIHPMIECIRQAINTIKDIIDQVKTIIQKITDFIKKIQEIIKLIKDYIEWILSLPAQILGYLVDCLNGLKSSLLGAMDGVTDNSLIKDISSISSDIESTVKSVEPIQNSLTSTGKLISNDLGSSFVNATKYTTNMESTISGYLNPSFSSNIQLP